MREAVHRRRAAHLSYIYGTLKFYVEDAQVLSRIPAASPTSLVSADMAQSAVLAAVPVCTTEQLTPIVLYMKQTFGT